MEDVDEDEEEEEQQQQQEEQQYQGGEVWHEDPTGDVTVANNISKVLVKSDRLKRKAFYKAAALDKTISGNILLIIYIYYIRQYIYLNISYAIFFNDNIIR